jgi:hypothetical protein
MDSICGLYTLWIWQTDSIGALYTLWIWQTDSICAFYTLLIWQTDSICGLSFTFARNIYIFLVDATIYFSE